MATPEIVSIPIPPPSPPPRTATVVTTRVSPSTEVTLVTRFIVAVHSFFTFLRRLGALFLARVKVLDFFVSLTLTASTLLSIFMLEYPDENKADFNRRSNNIMVSSSALLLLFIIQRVLDWRLNRKPWWIICIENFLGLIIILGSCATAALSYNVHTKGYAKKGELYVTIGTQGLTWLYGCFTNVFKNKHHNVVQNGTAVSFKLKKSERILEDARNEYHEFEDDNLVVTEAQKLSRLDQLEKDIVIRDRELNFWKTKYDEVEDENTKLKYRIKKFEEEFAKRKEY